MKTICNIVNVKYTSMKCDCISDAIRLQINIDNIHIRLVLLCKKRVKHVKGFEFAVPAITDVS